jgi:integrase
MARASMQPGQHGRVQESVLANGNVSLRVRYRPLDGAPPIQVTAQGSTRAAATRSLNRNIQAAETKSQAATGAESKATRARVQEEERALMKEDSVAGLIEELLVELEAYERVRPQTLAEYRRVTTKTINPLVGEASVSGWTANHTASWLMDVTGKTPSLFKTVKTILNQAASLGILHGRLTANPVVGIRNPRPLRKIVVHDGVEEEEDTVITIELDELNALRGAIRKLQRPGMNSKPGPKPDYHHLLDLVEVLSATGLRIGEATALRWKSVDLTGAQWRERGLAERAPSLTVEATVAWVKGGPAYIQPWGKSHASYRTLLITDELAQLLQSRRDIHEVRVFSAPKGGVWHPAAARAQLRKARTSAGIRDVITPHAFRRTFATQVELAHGVAVAAEAMGHRDPAITGKHYVKRGAKVAPDTRAVMKSWAAQPSITPDVADCFRGRNEVN